LKKISTNKIFSFGNIRKGGMRIRDRKKGTQGCNDRRKKIGMKKVGIFLGCEC
jgi:hypothetical protein